MLLRYIVNDVQEAIDFYTSKLGFELKKSFAPAVAFLDHGDLHLLVSGPDASASEPMLDGSIPGPGGGWSRFILEFDDLESVVTKLKGEGVEFRNEIVENDGRKQILCMDPSGNVVELFQPA